MNAFTIAAGICGDRQLTSDQIAQLRALDQRYWQAMAALRTPGGEQSVEAELGKLRAMLEADIRDICGQAHREPRALETGS